MENLEVIIQALEVAQTKGCYTLNEAVLIANAIGKLQKELEEKHN